MFINNKFELGQLVYCTSSMSVIRIDKISIDLDGTIRYWTKKGDRFEVIPDNCFTSKEEALSYISK